MAITFAGIESEVAAQLRLDLNKADQKSLIDRWINLTLEDIHGRHDWFWARERQVVQTVADKTDGTVAVALSSTTVTGTDTAFSSGDVGKFIQFSSNTDWYKITAVASATSLTIEKAFTPDTAATEDTYIIRQFYYSLPDAEKVLSAKHWGASRKLTVKHIREFDAVHARVASTGDPEDVFMWGLDSNGYLQYLIYPWPDSARNVEIRYKKKCTEDTVTYFPEKWRGVILDGALVRGLKYISVGNTSFNPALIDRAEAAYERGVGRMLADSEPESDLEGVVQSCEAALSPVGPELPDDYA